MEREEGCMGVEELKGGTGNGLGERFERLAGVMARLRAPDGCPWDLEQTPMTLTRHLLEEAYESVEAIESNDWEHLEEELGDLLLQVLFQSRIAEEHGRFDLSGVVDGITRKLLRRHPHVFGSDTAETAEEVAVNWERIKRDEEGKEGAVHVPPGLPAILAALKIQSRAARDGFDWSDTEGVFLKIAEEIDELMGARGSPGDAVERELGDLLFTVVNLARHLEVEPERALRGSSREFVRRYNLMEEEAQRRGVSLESLSPDEKDVLWREAKSKGT
jgi:tetrapyrrole methylase family protein/MazG family protein